MKPEKYIHDIEITNKMLTSYKSVHSRYLIALEDAKRQSQVTEKGTKRQLIKTEIADVKRRRVEFVLYHFVRTGC